MENFRELVPLLIALGVTALLWHLSRQARSGRPQGTAGDAYTVVLTDDSLACTHPTRPTEVVRWDDVEEIRLVTTPDPPPLPELWLVFVGRSGGCSIPLEAKDLEQLWPAASGHFPGFGEDALTRDTSGETDSVLWKR